MLRQINKKLNEIKQSSNNKLIAQATDSTASSLTPLTSDEIHTQSGNIIAQAKHEVCMQFYKFFGTSDGGKEIIKGLRALQERATEEKPSHPITVNVLLNARGKLAQTLYKKNYETGLEELAVELNNPYFQIRIAYHPTAAFGTLHTKMIVIDGKLAMLRGGDPAEPNNYNKSQFETALLSTGSNVKGMRDDFAQLWSRFRGQHTDLREMKSEDKKADEIPCIFISKKENGSPASVKYHNCESPYKIAMLEAISIATQSIKIMTPNLNDPDIAKALVEACNRGVEIQIIMGKYHNDSAEKHWGGTNFETIKALVDAIDSTHRKHLHIRWTTNSENKIVKHGEKYTLHGKYACIDDRLVFAGSTPLDRQGLYYSREADLIFEDIEQARIFNDKIFKDKFMHGKDYFVDCLEVLVEEINRQITELADRQGTSEIDYQCRKLASLLQANLKLLLSKLDHSKVANQDKPRILLEVMLPILEQQMVLTDPKATIDPITALVVIARNYGFNDANFRYQSVDKDVFMETMKMSLISELDVLLKNKSSKFESTYAVFKSALPGGRNWKLEADRIRLMRYVMAQLKVCSELGIIKDIIKDALKTNIKNSIEKNGAKTTFGKLHKILMSKLTEMEKREIEEYIKAVKEWEVLKMYEEEPSREEKFPNSFFIYAKQQQIETNINMAFNLYDNLVRLERICPPLKLRVQSLEEEIILQKQLATTEKKRRKYMDLSALEKIDDQWRSCIANVQFENKFANRVVQIMGLYDRLILLNESADESKAEFVKKLDMFSEPCSRDELMYKMNVIIELANRVIPDLEAKIRQEKVQGQDAVSEHKDISVTTFHMLRSPTQSTTDVDSPTNQSQSTISEQKNTPKK